VNPTIPDFGWYSAESKRLQLTPRCPFGNTNACPRYFQSLSLLGAVGHTPIAKDEDARLLTKWKQSPLWPVTDEQATSVSGPKDRLESLNNFCPEVTFDRFGLFASHLGRYADEIDSGSAHQRLAKEKAPANHPAWRWATLSAQHYSACPIYAPLSHDWPNLIKAPATTGPTKATGVAFDVFVSHASEDKDVFVRSLAAELTRLGLRVWYDEATLKLGDSLRQKIDEGLASSTYGVVILSPAFFAKNWPKAELDALFAREMAGQKVILPVWHCLTKEEILRHSPLLAAKLATTTDRGVSTVALEIFSIARPNTALPTSEPLPRTPPASNRAEPLTELLRTIEYVAPVLHKLDEIVVGKDARTFLQALQRLFHGSNILTEITDKNLRFGADNMLRVLSSEGLHPDYIRGKLSTAQTCFEDFRRRKGIGHAVPEVGREEIFSEIQFLHAAMHSVIEDAGKLAAGDRLPLRLIVALLEYGRGQHPEDPKKRFPQISPSIHHTLREYLTEAFRIQLNVTVPDTLETIWNGDMRVYCTSAWENLQREERDGLRLTLSLLRDTIRSWFRTRRVKTVTAKELVDDVLRQ
jgi:hypothetical protein